ncbi:hypothetical protein SDC9_88337 [bioreactor metagenome]|uniref:Uncharacterized protein n=1 Tax=bioreactor metagenome TaxID=1076179 RepID=A0A644ZP95_9ZZZZ
MESEKLMPCKKEQNDRKKGNYMTLKDILSRMVFGTKVLVCSFTDHSKICFSGVHERGGIDRNFDDKTLSADVVDVEIEDDMIVIGISL